MRPLMVPVPQQSEEHPSLLGNAREPPHVEGVIHMTGQVMAGNIKDVAMRAPDGSVGQIDSLRNGQLAQQGIAPGFENMQIPVPVSESVNKIVNSGKDIGRDDSHRDYGPLGQREADVSRHINQKEMQQKARDQAVDQDEFAEDKDVVNARRPVKVRTCYSFTTKNQHVSDCDTLREQLHCQGSSISQPVRQITVIV